MGGVIFNQIKSVLTCEQLLREYILNKVFCQQIYFFLTKENWQKPEPVLYEDDIHCSLPGQAGVTTLYSASVISQPVLSLWASFSFKPGGPGCQKAMWSSDASQYCLIEETC